MTPGGSLLGGCSAVALLELLARAARTQIVASDLRLFALGGLALSRLPGLVEVRRGGRGERSRGRRARGIAGVPRHGSIQLGVLLLFGLALELRDLLLALHLGGEKALDDLA